MSQFPDGDPSLTVPAKTFTWSGRTVKVEILTDEIVVSVDGRPLPMSVEDQHHLRGLMARDEQAIRSWLEPQIDALAQIQITLGEPS